MQKPVQTGVEQAQEEKVSLTNVKDIGVVLRRYLVDAIVNNRDGHFAIRRRDEPMFSINFVRVGDGACTATTRFRDVLLEDTYDTIDVVRLAGLMGTAYRPGAEHVIMSVLEEELGLGGKWSNMWPETSPTLVYVTEFYIILFMSEKAELQ